MCVYIYMYVCEYIYISFFFYTILLSSLYYFIGLYVLEIKER